MQSSNTRGTTLCTIRLALGHSVLVYKDWPHSQGTALLQCAREAQVLEDNLRVSFEYSKATHVIL